MVERRKRRRQGTREPTIHDVARAAGVSTATVSRWLSTPDIVREDTRQRVAEAVRSLGYRPNGAARDLGRGAISLIGFVAADLTDPGCSQMLRGVARRSREAGLLLLVTEAQDSSLPAAGLAARTAGLIVHAPTDENLALRELAATTPVVLLGRRVARMAAVVPGELGRLRKALQHLQELGHREVALVGRPPEGGWNESEAGRWRDAGLRVHQEGMDSPSFAAGYALATKLARATPTACIVFDDEPTRGMLAGLDAMGLRAPAGLSVVAAQDACAPRANQPGLTTVSAPLEDMGVAAVELLTRSLRAESPGGGLRTVRFETRLAIRGSTGPPRSAPG